MIQDTGLREMNDAKCFSLREGQLFEFTLALTFSLIGFRLAVSRARQLIMRFHGAAGPMSQAIIGVRRAHGLHRAQGEQKEKQTVPQGTDHDVLPLKKGLTVP